MFAQTSNGSLAVGDVSRRGGGFFPGHVSHRLGMDVDLRPVRRDSRQCGRGTTWRSRSYDRAGTIRLVRSIRNAAHGRVKLIFFNDPALVRAGLTKRWPHHGDHLHVRFCLPGAPNPLYACPRHSRHHSRHHHRRHHRIRRPRPVFTRRPLGLV